VVPQQQQPRHQPQHIEQLVPVLLLLLLVGVPGRAAHLFLLLLEAEGAAVTAQM
jgi:hypothetical protein